MKSSLTNLCFKNLPSDFEKQDLIFLCKQYGFIQNAKIMFDLKTGKSKGLGFVCFESPFSATIAKEKLNGTWISKNFLYQNDYKANNHSKKISVSYAITKENKGKVSNSIIVSSLPLFYRKKEIHDLFSKYGEIMTIHMIIDSKRKAYHGKAIIVYRTSIEAENASKHLNNIKLTNDSWPLFIQFYDKSNQIITDKNGRSPTEENASLDNCFGVEIKKPLKKERIFDFHLINEKIIQEKINDENFCRDQEMELFMFKMIAEEEY